MKIVIAILEIIFWFAILSVGGFYLYFVGYELYAINSNLIALINTQGIYYNTDKGEYYKQDFNGFDYNRGYQTE